MLFQLNESRSTAVLLEHAGTPEKLSGAGTPGATGPFGTRVVGTRERDRWDAVGEQHRLTVQQQGATHGLVETCHACSATRALTAGAPYVRRGDARFCPACWPRLTAAQIADVVRQVALRGVPLC